MILHVKSDDDFESLLDIHNDSFEAYEKAPPGMFREKFDTGTVFVAYSLNRNVLGYAIVTRYDAEPYVWEIAVSHDHRGQGVGSKLLREIAQWARGMNESGIGLKCRTENSAQTLYFANGYRVQKVLKGYYGSEGGDGLAMRRKLNDKN